MIQDIPDNGDCFGDCLTFKLILRINYGIERSSRVNMSISKFAEKAQTVLGLIEGKELGVTLPHEHLFMEHAKANFIEPSGASDRALAYKPVSLEILSWLHYHPGENVDNMRLLDEQEAIDEAMLFKKAGGNTIVDVTNVGIGRDPKALARVSRATGLNIIMGAGYYLGSSHPAELSAKTEDDITEEIVRDINVGVDNGEIRAGIIGEIGCSWPLQENERKVLLATARAQQLTGAVLSVHPGRKNNIAALEIVDLLADADADLTRVIIDHIDVRVRGYNERCEIAKAGCYLEYDAFGWEGHGPLSFYGEAGIEVPNDTQRIDEIIQLINEGHLNQILISQDICYKAWRARYGGRGCAHISNYVIPMMLRKGITSEQISTIMVKNPKRALCFV